MLVKAAMTRNLGSVVRSLPYADVCENNELRTYCISIKPLSMSGR